MEVLVPQAGPTLSTPWTAARQAPLSMGFSRPEHWSGLPCAPTGDPPDPGIEPGCPALQASSLPSEPPGKPAVASSVSVCCGIIAAQQPSSETLWVPGAFPTFISSPPVHPPFPARSPCCPGRSFCPDLLLLSLLPLSRLCPRFSAHHLPFHPSSLL